MEIRAITTADIPAIIHLGGRMHEESQYSILNYSPEKVSTQCYQAIESQNMMCMITVQSGEIVGMIAAQAYEYAYGADLIASDLLVYVAPEHRAGRAFLQLVKGYVTWAKEQGAMMIFMSQTTGVNQEAISNMYQRLGFDRVGGIHRMSIGA